MSARAILQPRVNSHPFQERTVTLEQPLKIGRAVARSRSASNNAIFDCKVLSRNHALLWYEGGKFYLQDTKSSNGTFVNNVRLSKSSEESPPTPISSGDVLQFGVDVMEVTKKVTHGCIVATLQLFTPDGKEAKSPQVTEKTPPTTLQDIYTLHQYLREAAEREERLEAKLIEMKNVVGNTSEGVRAGWKILIEEDRLLTRIDILERQLQAYHKSMNEDKLREEVIQLTGEKEKYQEAAKEALRKSLTDKMEVIKRCQELERVLSTKDDDNKLLLERNSRVSIELEELAGKYEDAERKCETALEEIQVSTLKFKEREEELETKIDEMKKESEKSSEGVRSGWQLLIEGDSHLKEDTLIARIDSLERQLQACHKNVNEDKLREEIIQLTQEKEKYEDVAKETLRKTLADKMDIIQKCQDLERTLTEKESNHNLLLELHSRVSKELDVLAVKYEDSERKYETLLEEMQESTRKYKNDIQSLNDELCKREICNGSFHTSSPPYHNLSATESDLSFKLQETEEELAEFKGRYESSATECSRLFHGLKEKDAKGGPFYVQNYYDPYWREEEMTFYLQMN